MTEGIPPQEGHKDSIKDVELTPGTYRIQLGFPRISAGDHRYFFGNRPKHAHEAPLELDTNSSEFKRLADAYKAEALNAATPEEKVVALRKVMEREFVSSSVDQDVKKLSEIIAQKQGACDSLVAIAGLLLGSEKDLAVERILGASNAFSGDTRPHDINHAWLRVSDGKQAVLYDPYFKVVRTYDLTSPELVLDADDPFYSYEVSALGAPDLTHIKGTSEFRGQVRLVKAEGATELWLVRPHALLAQITGEMDYQFTSSGATLRTVNDAVEVSKNPANARSARFLIPIQALSKA